MYGIGICYSVIGKNGPIYVPVGIYIYESTTCCCCCWLLANPNDDIVVGVSFLLPSKLEATGHAGVELPTSSFENLLYTYHYLSIIFNTVK